MIKNNKKKKFKIFISTNSFCKNTQEPLRLLKKNQITYDLNLKGRKLSENEIFKIIKNYDGLIADLEPLTKKVLLNAEKLKIISRVGIGVNNIDLKFAKQRNIVVKNTPDAPTAAVVEFTLGLIFALIRNVIIHDKLLKKGKWSQIAGLRIPFLKIGIIGFGRTGCGLAKQLIKIGSKQIFYNDIFKSNFNNKFIFKSKDYIFKNCDIICINLPETPQTKKILNKNVFKKMKKNSFLINTSRGGLICEKDLYDYLKKGYFAGVALDVFDNEPYKGNLIKFDRCILTPHVASNTIDCRNRMEIEATKAIVDFAKKN